MNARDLARIVREYRERNQVSQFDLAMKLGFTQATVSRIESGKQIPRPNQLQKLIDLIGKDAIPEFSQPEKSQESNLIFKENYSHYLKSEWNCFWVNRQLGTVGGDVLLVKELAKNNQVGILIGDSVGHGHSSAYMSFALEFAYSTIASMMSPTLLTPEFFERALGQGIVKTGASWRGEPSMEIIQVDLTTSTLSIINRGMPYPVLLETEKISFLNEKRAAAFSLDQQTASDGALKQRLEPGQSVLFFTDGLLDLMTENEITSVLQRLNKLFRGDARALGRNLIRILEKNGANKKVVDDVSFLILSRLKKGRANATA